jgi:hypothetical protein
VRRGRDGFPGENYDAIGRKMYSGQEKTAEEYSNFLTIT